VDDTVRLLIEFAIIREGQVGRIPMSSLEHINGNTLFIPEDTFIKLH